MEKIRTAKLLYAPGGQSADMYYATGLVTMDPFLYLEQGRKRTLFVNSLELSRAKKHARCAVEMLPAPRTKKEKRLGAVSLMLQKRGVKEVVVPFDFPAGLSQRISSNGIAVTAQQTPQFFARRMVKTEREVGFIEKTQEAAQQAIELAIEAIGSSKADENGRLLFDGKPLTSEFLQERIAAFLAARGFEAGETIVCSGEESAFPHARGSGRLWQGRQVVIDIFPRSASTRYYGDVTRTVVKGEPSARFVRMYEAVRKVQLMALDKICEGKTGAEIHAGAVAAFRRTGFENKTTNDGAFGFTHNIGHGVGLEVHEESRLTPTGPNLQAGNVVTVEPGLYYPRIGGVRIEDLVVVTRNGHRNLTRLGKELLVL